jgi:hypothetical protein
MPRFLIAETHVEMLGSDLTHFTDYLQLVTPSIAGRSYATRLFAESSVVLLMAWHEGLLGSLATTAAHEREGVLRAYLGQTDARRRVHIEQSSRAELIEIARRRLDFGEGGARISRFVAQVWGFDPWPSENVKRDLHDLNLLRQLIVHRGGGTVGDAYWVQFSRKTLLTSTRYGELPPVHRIDFDECLRFISDAFRGLGQQAVHIQESLRALQA